MKKEIINLKCPKCKMEVDPEAIKCPYCRSKLKHSKIIQAFVVIVFVGIIISILIADSNSNTTPDNNIVVPITKPVVAKTTTSQKQIPYQIVKRWDIPNGGEGKLIVISPNNLNEADMTALGENLRNDTKNDRNAFISIFDDTKAVSVRDAVLSDTASKANQDLYDKHFIGEYDRNINTGYNQLQIYFDGVMGTNQKTITY